MTLARRIIPCLDVDQGRVVKGIEFKKLRDMGDPEELAARYNREGADELVLLDITASSEGRATFLETIRRVARLLNIPFTAGGGIRSLEDGNAVLRAGADKVTINTAAIERPELISELAAQFGSQAVVLSMDVKRAISTWEVFIRGGRQPAGIDAVTWARAGVERGAGEILLTSMDRDGTCSGFDCELTSRIASEVSVPVIASGGAKTFGDFLAVFTSGCADAALAASIFHEETQSIHALKKYLAGEGLPMRLTPPSAAGVNTGQDREEATRRES
ncbi:MAG: imidazole glycerol phosphate synthase subunit HisF [Candidatus Binataceae bacterium]